MRLLRPARLALFLLTLLLAGCNSLAVLTGSGAPTPVIGTALPLWSGAGSINPGSTSVPVFVASAPTSTPPPGSTLPSGTQGWTTLTPAISSRSLSMSTRSGAINVQAFRIDPNRASISVYYTPGALHTLAEWRAALSTAVMLINGNYYGQNNAAIGLVVSNSSNYGGFLNRTDGGLFQVQNGLPRVRSLWLEPYNTAERIEQAAQGFPLLAARGQAAPISSDLDQGTSRRTVVANDRLGRIIFLITPANGCTLQEMAAWLPTAGLDIDMALNLDGGRSTQAYVAGQNYPGLAGVPLMIAVFAK